MFAFTLHRAVVLSAVGLGAVALSTKPAGALTDCESDLPTHADVQSALIAAVAQENGGFGLNMWATIVNRDGEVCVVAFSGGDRGD